MVTVSDLDKMVMIWGNPQYVDTESVSSYKRKGYRVVTVSNGTIYVKDCLKTVAKASGLIE